jgi:type IV pilus assembly protein PilM
VPRVVTAVDVGHDTVRMVACRLRDGIPELVGVATEPLDELGRLNDGPEKSSALRMRLARLAASARVPMREVVIGISGRTTIPRYVQIPPVPPWRLEALMRFEAAEQSGQAGRCAYDYRLLDVPDVEGQSTVLLGVSQEAAAEERTDLARAAGAPDPDVELASLGLFDSYVHGHGAEGEAPAGGPVSPGEEPGRAPDRRAEKVVLLLEIGAEEVHIVIARGPGLYFVRHQPGGGRRFTRAIEEALGLSWSEAEECKRTGARIHPEPGEAPSEEERRVSEALTREAADLARAVEATLLYCRAQTRLPELDMGRILLSGGGALLPGLDEFLRRRFRTEVSFLEPFRKVSLGDVDPALVEPASGPGGSRSSCLAVPLGMALSRLVPGAARLDLRPPEAKRRRAFRQRGLFLRAAAAVFAAGVVFWIAGAFRDMRAAARASETARERTLEDEVQAKILGAAAARNGSLQAEVDALRERITSGEDLLRVLSQFKKRTPRPIRFVELSTTPPEEIRRSAGAPKRDSTFQEERVIYARGYARSRKSHDDAIETVRRYQEKLAELKELFEEIKHARLPKEIEREDLRGQHVVEFVLALRIARPR